MMKFLPFILFPCLAISLPRASGELCTNSTCTFTFVVSNKRSMLWGNLPVEAYNRTHFRTVTNSYHTSESGAEIGKLAPAEEVISTDGTSRRIIIINGQFPGPTMEVMEGATVKVHVKNDLVAEPLTIHWHGIYQTGSPWMDGAAYVTQCPVLPQQTFTHTFIASPAGTHWYHSHYMSQRLDGLYGVLIVHPVPPTLPYFPLIIGEWYHEVADTLHMDNPYLGGGGEGYSAMEKKHYMVDGSENGWPMFRSVLINGRGRLEPDDPLPLTVFNVPTSTSTSPELRIVAASGDYILQVSVDGHSLTVVSSDGHTVEPVVVDSVVMLPGERYDVRVRRDEEPDGGDVQGEGSYWIRVRVLRSGGGANITEDGIVNEGLAILQYSTATSINLTNDEPKSQEKVCTAQSPCLILNCPFPVYPPNRTCIGLNSLRSTGYSKVMLNEKYGLDLRETVAMPKNGGGEGENGDEKVLELFYNFGFGIGSSINGRRLVPPRAPLLMPDDNRGYVEECDDEECDDKGCFCTHIQSLPANRVIQLVISSLEATVMQQGTPHSVHLHGHSFAVLKVGYSVTNATTGRSVGLNEDLTCNNGLCSRPGWTNGERPTLNLIDPPLKDTVAIPKNGYVVVRFRTDNPGYWFFHCHQETHFAEGMGMIFKEGDIPKPPKGFPTCQDFDGEYVYDDEEEKDEDGDDEDSVEKDDGKTTTPPARETTTKPAWNREEEDIYKQESGKLVLDFGPAIGILFALLLSGAVLSVCPLLLYINWMRKSSKLALN